MFAIENHDHAIVRVWPGVNSLKTTDQRNWLVQSASATSTSGPLLAPDRHIPTVSTSTPASRSALDTHGNVITNGSSHAGGDWAAGGEAGEPGVVVIVSMQRAARPSGEEENADEHSALRRTASPHSMAASAGNGAGSGITSKPHP